MTVALCMLMLRPPFCARLNSVNRLTEVRGDLGQDIFLVPGAVNVH